MPGRFDFTKIFDQIGILALICRPIDRELLNTFYVFNSELLNRFQHLLVIAIECDRVDIEMSTEMLNQFVF